MKPEASELDAEETSAAKEPAPPRPADGDAPAASSEAGADWSAASLVIRVDSATSSRVSPKVEEGEALRFLDSSTFDSSLRKALADDDTPSTTVTFEGAMSVNALPPRLDRWLAAVAKGDDGSIAVEPDPSLPQTRSIALIGVGLVVAKQAYDWIRTYHLYAPAKQHDVVVYVQPGTSSVTRVVFIRKSTEES